VKAIIKIFSF